MIKETKKVSKKADKVVFSKEEKRIINASKQISLLPFVSLIRYGLPIKQKYSLSASCYLLLFLVIDLGYRNIPVTASRLTTEHYGTCTNGAVRSMYYRMETLMSKGLVRRIDNRYYVTDEALSILSNVTVN